MILSGTAVQLKGVGWSLVSATKRLTAPWRSTIDRNRPRFSRRLVSFAKKPSTPLSQLAKVGVKWNVYRGWRANQATRPSPCGFRPCQSAEAGGGEKYDPRAPDTLLGAVPIRNDCIQADAVGGADVDGDAYSHPVDSHHRVQRRIPPRTQTSDFIHELQLERQRL